MTHDASLRQAPGGLVRAQDSSLRVGLSEAQRISGAPKGGVYVAADMLESLNTIRNISSELRFAGIHYTEIEAIGELFARNAFKLLCIFVSIDATQSAVSTASAGMRDADLPILKPVAGDAPSTQYTALSENLADQDTLDAFMRTQWSFLVVEFTYMGQHKHVHRDGILPMHHEEKQGQDHPVWRRCTRMRVDKAHLKIFDGSIAGLPDKWTDATTVMCVVKSHKRRRLFDLERTFLSACNRMQHTGIVALWASYEWQDHFYLILPPALCDLRTFWTDDQYKTQCDIADMDLWSFEQMSNLAEAVAFIQEELSVDGRQTYAVHGDLTADNVLLFEQQSMSGPTYELRLADFDAGGWSYDSETMNFGGYRGTYQAPELYIASRPYLCSDVWTFGCLILEFAIWLIHGSSGLESFAKSRIQADYSQGSRFNNDFFFDLTYPQATSTPRIACLNSAVIAVLARLETSSVSYRWRRLLNIVARSMLQIEPSERSDARGIASAICRATSEQS